jgi:hypothetical protein
MIHAQRSLFTPTTSHGLPSPTTNTSPIGNGNSPSPPVRPLPISPRTQRQRPFRPLSRLVLPPLSWLPFCGSHFPSYELGMGLGLNSNVGVGVDYMTAGVGVDYGRMMGTGEISLAISISVGGGGGCELRRTRVLREMLSHNYATLNPRLFFFSSMLACFFPHLLYAMPLFHLLLVFCCSILVTGSPSS